MEIKSQGIPSKKVIVFSRIFFAESLAKKGIMTIKQNGKQAGKNKTVETPPPITKRITSITTRSKTSAISHQIIAFLGIFFNHSLKTPLSIKTIIKAARQRKTMCVMTLNRNDSIIKPKYANMRMIDIILEIKNKFFLFSIYPPPFVWLVLL